MQASQLTRWLIESERLHQFSLAKNIAIWKRNSRILGCEIQRSEERERERERESAHKRERARERESRGGILAPAKHPFLETTAACDYRIRGPKKDLDEGDFCHLQGFYSIIEVPHGQTASTV